VVVVDDAGNASLPVSKNVNVVDNQAPTAVLSGPDSVSLGQNMTLYGVNSNDPGGAVVKYRWTKTSGGGGSMQLNQMVETSASNYTIQSTTNSPLQIGPHDFQLVAIDNSGNTSQPVTKRVMVVDNQPPTAVLDAPGQVTVGQNIHYQEFAQPMQAVRL